MSFATLYVYLLAAMGPATAPSPSRIVVAADGSGQFRSVQAAIDSIPRDNRGGVVIFIKTGDYPDPVRVNRSLVTLVGEDRQKVRLCATVDSSKKADLARAGLSWASVEVDGANDVTLENLTITNPFKTTHYAVALSSIKGSTRLIVRDCDLSSGGGDTVSPWSHGEDHFRNCRIEGLYHFLGPRGTCYVTDCQFWCLGSRISLFNEGTKAESEKLVVRNSTFDGPKAFGLGSYFRDAAWYFIDCTFSDKLLADGAIYRDVRDKAAADFVPKWGEGRVYFSGCKGPGYAWLKDNLAAAAAPSKEQMTPASAFGDWDPEAKPQE